MNIPWKLKSQIFRIIDFLDATAVLYFIQKNVTRRSSIKTIEIDTNWRKHQKALIDYRCAGLVFEFGGGKSLAQNLFLSSVVDRQIVVDLNPMMDIDLVNKSRASLANKVKLKSDVDILSLSDLNIYGIQYRSPYDAAKTDLNPNSLDACISTNTLEHIPVESIISIFMELNRVLKDSGIVSSVIDYSDHYAHTDSRISLLNYLNFSETDWQRFNHKCHYQNRLRHYDYKQIFDECGFEIISEDLSFSEVRISEFILQKNRDKDPTWSATSAHFVLKKKIINS
jgi:hypothetical protein